MSSAVAAIIGRQTAACRLASCDPRTHLPRHRVIHIPKRNRARPGGVGRRTSTASARRLRPEERVDRECERHLAELTRDPYMATTEQKTLAFGASGMMRESGDTLAANHGHASGGHTVNRSLLLVIVMRRTSAPSVKHTVRANVPHGGPVGVAFSTAMCV